MFDAATAPAQVHHPARAIPPHLGRVLGVVRTFIAYGRNLTETLRRHAADPLVLPCFFFVANIFATKDVSTILARISRGLLRAAALEERLRRRAARGLELKPTPTRLPRARTRCAAKPANLPQDPAQNPHLAGQPTVEQILARDHRRPIGAVLVDICRDLGIVVGQMDYATGKELRLAVMGCGGSLKTLLFKRQPSRISDDPATIPDVPIPRDSAGRRISAYPPWPKPPPQNRPAEAGGDSGPARPNQPPPLAGGSSREADRWGRRPGP